MKYIYYIKKKVEYILSLQIWFIKSGHETGTMIAISPNADESEKYIRYMMNCGSKNEYLSIFGVYFTVLYNSFAYLKNNVTIL